MTESTAPSPAADAGHSGLRAVVLCGGLNFEREVSLSSGTQVVEELARAGLDAELYRGRRGGTPGSLASLMPAGTTWTRPDGGFYVWLKLPHGLDAKLMQPRA